MSNNLPKTFEDDSESIAQFHFGKPYDMLTDSEMRMLSRWRKVEQQETKKTLRVISESNDLDSEVKRSIALDLAGKMAEQYGKFLNDTKDIGVDDFCDDSHKERGGLSSHEKYAKFMYDKMNSGVKMIDVIAKTQSGVALGKLHSDGELDDDALIKREERKGRIDVFKKIAEIVEHDDED